MTLPLEQPIRAYAASQLEKIGCGAKAWIIRQCKKHNIGFIQGIIKGSEARLYLFRDLLPEWKIKADAYEGAISAEKARVQADAIAEAGAAKLQKIMEQDRLERETGAELPLDHEDREFIWRQMGRKKKRQQDKATMRGHAVTRFWSLRNEGREERDAVNVIAKEMNVHPNSVRNWVKKTKGFHFSDRAAVLISQHQGNSAKAEFTPEAWEFFKKDYLRRVRRSIAACYRDTVAAGKANGWIVPIERTVINWIQRELDPMVIKFKREGMDAVEKCFPAMKRNKEMFEIMQAINGDGYQFGLWADFGNGIVEKPKAWFWQDIRSSKMLSWRVDVSENSECIRLSILDLITDWGIPEFIYLDNTTSATAKQISGRIPNRYRYKNKETDPQGIIPKLGIYLNYTLPASGRSKPIERAFGIGGMSDFDSWPVFVGRGTKGRPIPIAEFEAELKSFVAEWNARPDRRGDAVEGKSFNEVFNFLYPQAIITRPTEKQRKHCMMAVEVVMVSKTDASIALTAGRATFGNNRYWSETLTAYMGQLVTVRFDPANLHSGVYVETLDGIDICKAEPIITGGFRDVQAGREVARARNSFKKGVKLKAEAEERLTAAEARAQMPVFAEEPPPHSKVTRIAAGVPQKAKAAPDQGAEAAVTPVITRTRSLYELFGKKTANTDCHETDNDMDRFARAVNKMKEEDQRKVRI